MNSLFTRLAVLACGALGAVVLPVDNAWSQAYPSKPVTLLVGFAPGGAADTVARLVAEEMGKRLGQPVIVENKSGAGGNIATQALVSAPADGHTLLFAAINLATNPTLTGVKYDPNADLQMVSQISSVPVIMLTSEKGTYQSVADVTTAARKTAGGLKVGSGGLGTSSHLAPELFSRALGVTYLHVPFRGGAPANQALMAGEVELMFDLMSGTLKSILESGRLRPLAVMQDARIAMLPNVPSAREAGLPASTYIRSWQGIAVRGGTPQAVVDKLHAAVVAAASTPAVKARIEQLGSEVVTSRTPAEFQQHYMAELARWTALIKAANIKPE